MNRLPRFYPTIIYLVLNIANILPAQELQQGTANRWESQIQKFEAQDQQQMPKKKGILFVGSSSVRLWDTAIWFPNETIINRGFGGSETSDVNHYFNRIVANYAPQIIAIYEGDNDIARGKSVPEVLEEFQTFWSKVSSELPNATVVFIPIKPSPKRWELWPKMKRLNDQVRQMAKQNHNLRYADIVSPMMKTKSINKKGQPARIYRRELFTQDNLHMNSKGYQIWTRVLQQELKDIRNKMTVHVPDLLREGDEEQAKIVVEVTDTATNGPWTIGFRIDDRPWQTMNGMVQKGDKGWSDTESISGKSGKLHSPLRRYQATGFPADLGYGKHEVTLRLFPTQGKPITITRSFKLIEE